ncbi:Asparaginase [Aphelenchoides bicaudatus]|nr:Asparaginase [Aphelenchoides bicaudatus]
MISVHGGIGESQTGVEKLCADAIREASSDVLDVVKAVMFLENDGITNCGIGSSLTTNKTVECEAGYMSSNNLIFGSVGSLTNCKHPSILAKKLATAQLSDSRLIPPICLAGQGANDFACECEDVPTCSNSDLITKRSTHHYEKAKGMLDQTWDTVGACSIGTSGVAAACVSSGGLILKRPGRLGHSATFGAGVWAEQRGQVSVSISLTGCGEAIIRTGLAQQIANSIFDRDDETTFLEIVTVCVKTRFLGSRLLANFSEYIDAKLAD